MMSNATQRTICRWIHIVFGLSIVAYIYGPPEEVVQYRDNFRFVFVPVIVLSGFWMWKGHVLLRPFSKKSV
ncbi:MAG: hypothetical protein JWM57_257, partial [Phycisphaerales bacterium]|nr:hypothetical protein [Phycisphaerales bacterium]